MRLIQPKPINFEQVLNSYYKSHGDLSAYETRLLNEANKVFSWIEAGVYTRDMGGLVLPFHVEKESGNIVIPPEGEMLDDAYRRLLCYGREYYNANTPDCFGKVMFQREKIKMQETGIFLFSRGAFREFSRTYENVQCSKTDLVHLDGFHRLLALMDISLRERPEMINSYIAIRKNPGGKDE